MADTELITNSDAIQRRELVESFQTSSSFGGKVIREVCDEGQAP